jgi:hypothetical protein
MSIRKNAIKKELFWNSLIYFRLLYQPIEGAVSATSVVEAAARSRGKL